MVNNETLREVTVSLPDELLAYADQRARELNTSRSEVISQALSAIRASETEELATEGYRYYADEASEFAQVSARAVAETWDDIWQGSINGNQS
jgi:metal-responsive CopG/Arc/MetJ family transcriptional regulator